MKLQKHNWKTVRLTDICDVANGATPKGIDSLENNGIAPFFRVSDMNLEGNEIYMNNFTTSLNENEIKNFKVKLYPEGTVIFPKRGASIHTNKKRLLSKKSAIDLNTMGLIPKEETISYFLFTWFQTINLSLIADGSYIPQINNKNISGVTLSLPPVGEQQKIADLFKLLDVSLEQAEQQEKNLRSLARRLIYGLLLDEPTFGNLLEGKQLTKIKFGDIAEAIEQHERHPLNVGLTRFIGLENIEPETFRISTWRNTIDGTTFTKTFAKGDVLFGKRRAYLKKVAVAEFDGLCSSDILVFRAQKEKILPELLPFYSASESFVQHAVNTSAGSLSPRTKWRDLAKFELSIPELETQSKILDVLQQIQKTVEQIIEQKQTLKNLKFKLLNEILG